MQHHSSFETKVLTSKLWRFQWQCDRIQGSHEHPNVCFIQITRSLGATYVLNWIFSETRVLRSTTQTTGNHEGYPLVFHLLNFNLKLRVWCWSYTENHTIESTMTESRTEQKPAPMRFASIGYILADIGNVKVLRSKLCVETSLVSRSTGKRSIFLLENSSMNKRKQLDFN